jgi:hypothetical protein
MFINKYSSEYSAIKYGIYAGIVLSAIFILFMLLNLTGVIWLRIIDVLILYLFVSKVVDYYMNHHSRITYFVTLGLSFLTCAISMVFFSAFLFAYNQFIDPGFMDYLKMNAPMGAHLNPYIISATLIIEGIAIGFIISMIKANTMKSIKE